MLAIITLAMLWRLTKKKDDTHSTFMYILMSFLVTVFILVYIFLIVLGIQLVSGLSNELEGLM